MPELKDAVAAAVARWREIEEPCPVIGRTTGFHYQDVPETTPDGQTIPKPNACGTCAGTGYVQPAIVLALIEAVTIPRIIQSHRWISQSDYTDRVPRDWEEIGEGALEGVLRVWYYGVGHPTGRLWVPSFHQAAPLSNTAALAAVNEALKRMYGGSHDHTSNQGRG